MKVIIMIGNVGSGKTTAAKKYFADYVYINQDTLGSKQKCLEEMVKALQSNKDVIIDRTNINKKQRREFINIAKYHGADSIVGIYLDVPDEECISRIHLRKGHETINNISLEEKRKIVYRFSKDYEPPELSEGFSSIIITNN